MELATEELPGIYADLMRQVKRRLDRVRDAYKSAVSNEDRPTSALDLEQCYLQLRLTVELVAVGTLLAHNELEEFRSTKLLKAWHAESLLKRLSKISDDAFPRPITVTEPGLDGVADLFLHAHERHREEAIKFYNRCGDCLHTGTLKSLLRDGGRFYDPEEVRIALNFFVSWLDQHAILLPGGKRMLVAFLKYRPSNDVHCFLTDFAPDRIFDPRDYPKV